MKIKLSIAAVSCLIFFQSSQICAQDLNIKIGHTDILKSEILNEERELLIHLPDNYDESNKTYPVLYRLDGSIDLMIETVATANRLTYSDEITPEMIIVEIKNIDRDKDMWPTNTKYYPEPKKPGANRFLRFIGEELVPYIDNKYRTTQERIICGQSLSSVFVLYAFLKQPELFKSYIASSGAFPDCEEYFNNLTDLSLAKNSKFGGQKLFITNGMKDPLDPEGVSHRHMINFSNLLIRKLGGKVSVKYFPYENEGHVPFHSLYDGLKFLY